MQNPYTNKTMLQHDSDMFFGREREMRIIESLLKTDQSVSIVGERRIGKSSVANRVYHKLKVAPDTMTVFLDCDGLSETCDSKDKFFRKLNGKLAAFLEERQDIRSRLKGHKKGLFTSYSTAKRFVQMAGSSGLRFVIFMDEFEHLPDKGFADDTFFSNLRAMANHPDSRLAFVTISQTNLKELTHKAIKTSGFWNIFTPETIGLLDDISIDKLRRSGFQRNNLSLEQEEIEKIHHYAGNFPFFNQIVCKHIFDAKVHNAVLDEGKLKLEFLPHYEKLWESRTEKEKELLFGCLKDKQNSKQDFHLKEDMKARGLLREVDSNFYRPFSKFFYDFIKGLFRTKDEKEGHNSVFRAIVIAIIGFIIGVIISFMIFKPKDYSDSILVSLITGTMGSVVANKLSIPKSD